jgi:Asp-tRNA(Asn)/Glu-tRNA(Gln) amidotransferase A subunit family amidase
VALRAGPAANSLAVKPPSPWPACPWPTADGGCPYLPARRDGHPALTVPAGTGAHDLPVGVQLIGRRFDEMTLYQAGFAVELR